MSTPCNKATKLRDAADSLVKLAIEDAIVSQPITLFKESVEKKLDATSKTFRALNEELRNIKSELTEQSEELRLQRTSLEALKSEMANAFAKHSKDRKLEWAISNCHLRTFKYYNSANHASPIESTSLVREILICFRQDVGIVFEGGWMTKTRDQKGESEFREKLQNQLHELLGHKPRLANGSEGWSIHYS